jgi:cytochrome o ubiquinol oxidase subunit 2
MGTTIDGWMHRRVLHGAHPDRSAAMNRGRAVCAMVLACGAAGCVRAGIIDPHGPVSQQDLQILINSLAVMMVIAIPTILAALGFAFWFRASNSRAKYLPDFVYSGRVELIVWSIPILTITFLGGLIWIGSVRLDPRAPIPSTQAPLPVQVVSLDWKWLFIYPQQGVASVNELVAPAGRPVRFDLTSASVMNVFFVPQLGSQIYTMNGMVTQLNLQADQPGDYYGLSAHFSGDGFSDMHFQMKAVPPADFERWVATVRASGPVLDHAAYADLAKQSQHVAPFTYREVEPGLFDAVATRMLPPGPGPVPGPGPAGGR